MFASRVEIVSFLAAASLLGASASTDSALSYDPTSEHGPLKWKNLEIDVNQCEGESNSTIAIEKSGCTRFEDYSFRNGECTFNDITFELTSTGVKGNYPDTCVRPKVEIPGIDGEYEAFQFHTHLSSEHIMDGIHSGAELHTVHTEVGGDRYAVVAMMIQPDDEEDNAMFDELLTGWQALLDSNLDLCKTTTEGRPRDRERRKLAETDVFSPYMLIPEGSAYYHYDGGLTTPPCSEVVWWNIADKPVSLDPAQFHQLIDLILNYDDAECHAGTYAGPAGSTARPAVALNAGRTVDRVCPVGYKEKEDDAAATFSFSTLVGAAFVVGAAMLF